MTRVKLTKEDREELSKWTILIHYIELVDREGNLTRSGWTRSVLFNGREVMGGGIFPTLHEAAKETLHRGYRGNVSPLGYDKPIPPRNVMVSISAKFLKKNKNFCEDLESLITSLYDETTP